MNGHRTSLAVAFTLAAALAAVSWRMHGPEPLAAVAPADRFSASRASDALRTIVGGTQPRPLLSAEHDRVRDRIAGRFASLGYSVRITRAFACSPAFSCASVENIVASLGDDGARPVILATAHYDSVPAAPGASDDGAGVAVLLEVARAMARERPRNPVVFLIDDGEEVALLGAEAFVRDDPLRRRVAAVVNVEARGTQGPSFLFETSRGNRRLAPLVARALPRPVTTSVFAAIYDRLPNDTDLSVFKRAGLQGVNFAFIGNVNAYHTPNDDVSHLDLRTLQHHGDNALAAIRTLSNSELPGRSGSNAVWFDLLGLTVLWWPEPWSVWLAIAALVVSILAALRSREPRGALSGFALLPVSLVLSGLLAIAVAIATHGGTGATWIAHPWPAIAAAWIIGLTSPLLPIAFFRRQADENALLSGIAVAWSVLAVATSMALPGASYLFIVPGALLAICALLRARTRTTCVVSSAAAAVLFFPFGLVLYDALGRPALVAIALLTTLVATTCAAAVARSRIFEIGAPAAVIVLVALSRLTPAYTSAQPRHVNLLYLDDGSRQTWATTAMTRELAACASWTPRTIAPWLLKSRPVQETKASNLHLEPVALRVENLTSAGPSRRLRLTIHSPRGAQRVLLAIRTKAEVRNVRVNDVAPPPPTGRFVSPIAPGWHRVVVRGRDAVIDLEAAGREPLDVMYADYSWGLPAEGQGLAAARAASPAVPADDGDTTITLRRARL